MRGGEGRPNGGTDEFEVEFEFDCGGTDEFEGERGSGGTDENEHEDEFDSSAAAEDEHPRTHRSGPTPTPYALPPPGGRRSGRLCGP